MAKKKAKEKSLRRVRPSASGKVREPTVARDVLIYLAKALQALEERDTEGVEIYVKLASRAVKGKG